MTPKEQLFEQRIDDVLSVAHTCDDHPNSEREVQFKVGKNWRGWQVFCSECNQLIDELDE